MKEKISKLLWGHIKKEGKPIKEKFEALFNEAIKDNGYQFLSDKSTAYYWYKRGMEERS
jgi:hypothetical protein